MYLSDSANLLTKEENLANENNYRLGLKLVRGLIFIQKNRDIVIHKLNKILIIIIIWDFLLY